MLPPIVANGGSYSLGLSSGGDKVHHQDPLYLERMLVSGQLKRLGHHDCLLAGELALPLRRLALGIDLLSVGSRSLVLPKGMMSLRRELGVRPRHDGLRQNRHHGLSGQSVLRPWCACDGARSCPHATCHTGFKIKNQMLIVYMPRIKLSYI
jgi:hypothetical protein